LAYLYFDVETVPTFDSGNEYLRLRKMIDEGKLTRETNRALYHKVMSGARNPHEGKVISIAYALDEEKLEILREWELTEPRVLQSFYDVADKATRESWQLEKPITYVGFNILGFDIPFMFCRMQHHGILTSAGFHDPKWLFRRLFQFSVDLLQVHLPLNDFESRGLSHNALCCAYGLPTKRVQGDVLATFYYKEEYQKIEDYIQREFVYPKIFRKILNEGLVGKAKLRSSLKGVVNKKAPQKGSDSA